MSTTNLFNGTGSQTAFTIDFPYLAQSHLVVEVLGVVQTLVTDYTVSGAIVTFESGSIPASGTNNVSIARVTPSTPLVDFSKGGSISEANLDDATQQGIFTAEENRNNFVASTFAVVGGHWDATNKRITNLDPAVAETDAATKADLTAVAGSATAAATSATNAATSASAAATAKTDAETAETAAQAAQAAIENVYPLSSLVIGEQLFATSTTAQTSKVSRGPQLVSEITIDDDATAIVALTTAFSRYVIDLEYLILADAENLELTFSVDNQSNYVSVQYDLSGGQRAGGTLNGFNMANDAQFTLHDEGKALGADTGELSYCGHIEILPGDGVENFRISGRGAYHDSGGNWVTVWYDGFNDSTIVRATHIKILAETSNIVSGIVRVWGIV